MHARLEPCGKAFSSAIREHPEGQQSRRDDIRAGVVVGDDLLAQAASVGVEEDVQAGAGRPHPRAPSSISGSRPARPSAARRRAGRRGRLQTLMRSRPTGRTGFGCRRQVMQLPTPADRRTTSCCPGAPTSPRPIVRDPGPPLAVPARTTLDRRRAEPARRLGTFADSYLTDADGATSIELTMRGCRPQPACRFRWRRKTR